MSHRPRVLCAEPSADICSLLHALLDQNGFDSDLASTITEAVDKARDGDYCLYIVDEGYTDRTNVEMIRRLPALAQSPIVKPGEIDRLIDAVVRLCGAR